MCHGFSVCALFGTALLITNTLGLRELVPSTPETSADEAAMFSNHP
jgi:hypothetical protein